MNEILVANIVERINVGLPHNGMETLKWMDSRSIADVIRNDHPQIIAVVLAYLDPDMAAEVLAELPQSLHGDVMMRIATLDEGNEASEISSEQTAANIINALEPGIESSVMEHMDEVAPALAARIQERVFVFDNLIDVEDGALQEILRQVRGDQLLLALKGCDELLKQKIFRNMSQREAEMLRDDLEAKGPVRLTYVETAQKDVLAVARRLAEEGTIALRGKGERLV